MTMKYTLPIGAKLHSPKRTYTIEKVLGQGGFGITYKVSANLKVDNVTIRTHFAIKELARETNIIASAILLLSRIKSRKAVRISWLKLSVSKKSAWNIQISFM